MNGLLKAVVILRKGADEGENSTDLICITDRCIK